ncbi:helix-turn-helix transcriptional regulator [Microvirga calopogonii]|uniref:helix-turn-helix transcriptional regulator n=1 Tax=Microvirga calopogonii TaxID=2078013 RepID=UPI000E0D07BA|nr:helix-turn-helix domain-containing protein [Microvirga calopogonii]
MNSPTPRDLLDVKTAAKRLGLSKSTLDKLRVYGGGPRFSKLGRSVRYSATDLDNWVHENRRTSTSAAA